MSAENYPIRFVYSNQYNFNLEGLVHHPILIHLSNRYKHIADYLKDAGVMHENNTYIPNEDANEIIESITTSEYRQFLSTSEGACSCFLRLNELVDEHMVESVLLDPMKRMTMGTLKAAQLSYECGGMSINLGGGFHHARRDSCGGFCIYNDFLASAQWLWGINPNMRILYIDLDAHLGDGVLAECAIDSRFFHYDIYNTFGSERIDKQKGQVTLYGLPIHSKDSVYFEVLYESLEEMVTFSKPDFVFYNAGSDPLVGDELGMFKLTSIGLLRRDEFVFNLLKKYEIPSIMTLSGGYTSLSIDAVSRSIANLKKLSTM